MTSTVTVSASVDVPNDCYMECRVDMNRDVEVTLGTWAGSAELHFKRHALERFVELATAILNEPIPTDPKAPRPSVISRGSELHHPQP